MACNRCESCKGQGKVVGLGCMQKECPACAGVGYIAVDEKPVSVKRTRKPRSVPCPKPAQEEGLQSIAKS